MVVMVAGLLQWLSVSGGLGGQQTYTESGFETSREGVRAAEELKPSVAALSDTAGLPYFPPTLYPTVTPTLAPPPTPVAQAVAYTPVSVGVEQWRSLVASIFPADTVDAVLRVMRCESGGNANATGSAGERGLMQIHPLHADSTYDPEGNLRAAYRISGGGYNWSAWSCRP